MRAFTDEEIINRVASLSTFKGWRPGIYDVWVRSAADKYDAFDDKCFTYQVHTDGGRPEFVMARQGTTNAGSYGLKHFKDYNHKGCAVLKADWMIYGSHTYGMHKGKPAYRQAKGWPYFRDDNRNERAEEIGPEYNDIIGANVHRAGVNSTVIKNWSTACLVTATLQVFLDWLGWMKKQGRPPLNVAILKEWPKGEQPEPAASELRTLKIGDEGDDVKRLQAALRIKADGIFGRGTRAAVIAFQSERNMRPDGIVGPNTRSEIGI